MRVRPSQRTSSRASLGGREIERSEHQVRSAAAEAPLHERSDRFEQSCLAIAVEQTNERVTLVERNHRFGRELALASIEPVLDRMESSITEKAAVELLVERIMPLETVGRGQRDPLKKWRDLVGKLVAHAGITIAVPPHCPQAARDKQLLHPRERGARLHPMKGSSAGYKIERSVHRRIGKGRLDYGQLWVTQTARCKGSQGGIRLDCRYGSGASGEECLCDKAGACSDLKHHWARRNPAEELVVELVRVRKARGMVALRVEAERDFAHFPTERQILNSSHSILRETTRRT